MNGNDVTSSVVNNLSLVVPPMSSTMLTVPFKSSLGPGSLYTVVLIYAEVGSIPSVAGGRLAKTHFPIESWPKSSECPYPTVNDKNYKVRYWYNNNILYHYTKITYKMYLSNKPKNVSINQSVPKIKYHYPFMCADCA